KSGWPGMTVAVIITIKIMKILHRCLQIIPSVACAFAESRFSTELQTIPPIVVIATIGVIPEVHETNFKLCGIVVCWNKGLRQFETVIPSVQVACWDARRKKHIGVSERKY